MFFNTTITYPLLLILSTAKRSFEALGAIIGKSGDTIKRWLRPKYKSLKIAQNIAQHLFAKSNDLTLSVDDTLIKKIYSTMMVGTGW